MTTQTWALCDGMTVKEPEDKDLKRKTFDRNRNITFKSSSTMFSETSFYLNRVETPSAMVISAYFCHNMCSELHQIVLEMNQ